LFNTKIAFVEAILLLILSLESIGCSLTIHRVEISVVRGNACKCNRASDDILIASKRI